MVVEPHIIEKVKKLKLVLTDVDGVLTDTGVFVGPEGELFKRYSIRDGMGVERLRNICGLETGIVTGELSKSVQARAAKLSIQELHLGIKDKPAELALICKHRDLTPDQIAYIGDDYNDLDMLKSVGLSASPANGMPAIREVVDIVTESNGGFGAFRDLAELIIYVHQTYT